MLYNKLSSVRIVADGQVFFRISNTAVQVFHVPDFAMKLSDKITAGLLNGASSGEHNCTHFLMAK